MTQGVREKAPKKRKIASLDKRKARGGWLFVLPFVIGFVLIYLPILIESIHYSFCEIDRMTVKGVTLFNWVGFANYEHALTKDSSFTETLVSGLGQMVFDIPMILIFSLFMAVLLNQKMAGRAVFRAIFFVPVILATGIAEIDMGVGMDDAAMEGIDDGSGESAADNIVNSMDVEQLFAGMAVGQGLVRYVTEAINNIYNIVNRSGVQILIFLAGLQSISPAIYESVSIDGATSWETFWKITFPMISPMILVNAVYTIIDSFTTSSNEVMTYISSQYGKVNGEVISSAMSWIYFGIVILIIGAVAAIISSMIFYRKR